MERSDSSRSLPAGWSILVFLMFLSAVTPSNASSLFPYPAIEVGERVAETFLEDLNGDGTLDLMILTYEPILEPPFVTGAVILLGKGEGIFEASERYWFGYAYSRNQVTFDDINGDGVSDLLRATFHEPEVKLMLSSGKGTLLEERIITVPEYPGATAVGDFDRDGHIDLAVTHIFEPYKVSIHRGNSGAEFTPWVEFELESRPILISSSDLNSDGHQDLVIGTCDGYWCFSGLGRVLLNRGGGNFEQAAAISVPGHLTMLELEDVDRDGLVDVVLGGAWNYIGIFRNLGEGQFNLYSRIQVRFDNDLSMADFGDFNADGITDAAVTSGRHSSFGGFYGSTSVVWGKEDGTFEFGDFIAFDAASASLADIDRDGDLDLITGDFNQEYLKVSAGNGDGTFGMKPFPLVDDREDIDFLERGAFIGEEADSLVAAGRGGIFILQTDGHQTEIVSSLQIPVRSLDVADLNDDGHDDLISLNSFGSSPDGSKASILLGEGDGLFRSVGEPSFPEDGYPLDLKVGDFDGDGVLDLVGAVGGTLDDKLELWLFLGRGDGSFERVERASGSIPELAEIAIGEFNGDEMDDLVYVECGSRCYPYGRGGRIEILIRENITIPFPFPIPIPPIEVMVFKSSALFETAGHPISTSVEVVELNGDGRADIVAITSTELSVLLGDGDGTFVRTQRSWTPWAGALTSGDFNADGHLDLAVLGPRVLLGASNGTFEKPIRYAGRGTSDIVSVDSNRDGRHDLAELTWMLVPMGEFFQTGAGLSIHLNKGPFPELEVEIDVKPDDEENTVPVTSRGVLPVAILGSDEFNAASADPATLRLNGAPVRHVFKSSRYLCHTEDVNEDEVPDLLCQFVMAEMALHPKGSTAVLEGATFDGQSIRGEQSIRLVPAR